MAEFAVIGMGRFGRGVAQSLALEGGSVLAIDRDPRRLDEVSSAVDTILVADTTDERQVAALRLDRLSCAVVTIGPRSTEASVLTTAILRDNGVPRVVARAFDDRHGRLLMAVGASEVLNPEADSARLLALRLAYPGILAQLRIGEAMLAEVAAPESFAQSSLADLELRERYHVSVLAMLRDGETLLHPSAHDLVQSRDVLVLIGPPAAIRRLSELR